MKKAIIAICIVGILLGVLMTFSASAHPGLDDVRAKHESQLIAIKGVSGVASDKATNEIVVFTETQKDCDKVPKDLDGFKVRCEATGRIEALQPTAVAAQSGQQTGQKTTIRYSRTGQDRPVFGGISVGSSAYPGSAGTIGLVTSNGQVLSCAHVLAMDSSGKLVTQADVWQPGGYDRGTSANKIGTLTSQTTITFNNPGAMNNKADAAYATLSTGITYKQNAVLNAANTGWVTISSQGIANPGDTVSKSGRTTGVTTSKVTYTGATVTVWYTQTKYAVFTDQILIYNQPRQPPFSAAGDSGSVIYNTQGQFVGLLFAGSNTLTVANTATNVINGLSGFAM